MRIRRSESSWIGVGIAAAIALVHGDAAFGQIGACCRGDGLCIATDNPGCTAIAGEFLGGGSVCASGICLGACCTDDKGCFENYRDFCGILPQRGSFQGARTTCELNCPSHLTTAFTYQGQLKDGGVPVSNTVDLECSLWTTVIGGTQVLSTLSLSGVEVVNGLFTVDLNFGPGAFTGNTRWLEIAMRSPHDATNTLPFTTLTPRQPMTATPNALFARFARGAELAVNAYLLDGLDSTAFLQSVPNPLTLSGESTTHIIKGENTSTVGVARGLHGAATGATGIAIGVLGESGSSSGAGVLGIATSASGVTLGGLFQSVSTDGIGVLGSATTATGTTYGVRGQVNSPDGFAGYFEGRGYFSGNVGIGNANPASPLQVEGSGADVLLVTNTGNGRGATVNTTNDTAVWATTTNGFAAVDGRNAGASGFGVYALASAAFGTNYGVYGQSNSATGYDVYAGGAGIDYGSSSSIRWKSNVRNIDQPLEKVARLRGVHFDWDAAHGGHHGVGMIAEEVGQVLPEIVGYEENGVDANGMDYGKLTPLLVEAINELQAKVREKDGEIEVLRSDIEELKKVVKALASAP